MWRRRWTCSEAASGAALLEAARRWRDEKQDRDGKQDRNGVPVRGVTFDHAAGAGGMDGADGSASSGGGSGGVFGKRHHASAYPPWQLHRAEIYHVDRGLWGFTRKGLRRILRRYSKTAQRFGK